MKQKIAKLIDLKSIITLILVIAFTWGFIVDKVDGQDFVMMVIITMNFYFTKKDKKGNEEEN